MTTQFLPHLSQDLTKLFESKKNYDFIINVDKDVNKKEFYVQYIQLFLSQTEWQEKKIIFLF